MADIMNKVQETSDHLQRFLKVLSEWKAENDAHRARLDAMGEELLKTMEGIKKAARDLLPKNKPTQSDKPSVEFKSVPPPLLMARRSPTVLKIVQSQSSASKQNQVNKQLKQKDTNRVMIKKEIDAEENTTGLPKLLPMKKVICASLLTPNQIKKEPHVATVPKDNLKRNHESSVSEIIPKIPRTTRSQAKALLSKDILESISSIKGTSAQSMADTSKQSINNRERVVKPSKKVGGKRKQNQTDK
ncbi:uncharacterized protein LOC129580429 [Sitodiplosis mosellana]|uniref:uncharacterized protein LOC129580429 n=1 Tax=Sitodiplosis mosellana TaxID=263140 RepID=UPI0024439C5B|nr:uncharacterized protein LOC129580429 [Sitodiplosis mosellana]